MGLLLQRGSGLCESTKSQACKTLLCFDRRLRVVSNFGDQMAIVGRAKYTRARAKFEEAGREGNAKNFCASPRNFVRARVYFARPAIAIAKIRDYSQSTLTALSLSTNVCKPDRYW